MDLLTTQAAPGATVVVDDQTTYEQLYSSLHGRFRLTEVETFDYLPPWEPRLAATAAQSNGQLWVYDPVESPLHEWLAGRFQPLASQEFDGWRLTGWKTQ
jgi:hypothetical protein